MTIFVAILVVLLSIVVFYLTYKHCRQELETSDRDDSTATNSPLFRMQFLFFNAAQIDLIRRNRTFNLSFDTESSVSKALALIKFYEEDIDKANSDQIDFHLGGN
ncbi:hypothetical protein M3Y98_00378900 [Aphelenchoides besseyi]|nr:hypothetical protein M3Y98_00378900 [Aphelenchoides besseyi]KAI6201890.1 hypothetical protein M3Y96_00890400 [Aphelenchoides besseyi]